MLEKITTELEQFRQRLYQNFNNRADTLMEVIDAMCSSPGAESPVELTLAACYRRSYSTLYNAVDGFEWGAKGCSPQMAGLLAPYLPMPEQRRFWLLGVDVTSRPRAYAPTVRDRGMVYQLPMHEHPFMLVRSVRFDEPGAQRAPQAEQHPLWLLVIGVRRHELSLSDIYHAYEQRFDLEHFFRFGKQKLLLTDFQTPDTDRQEKWWQLVHLAYAQLWMARHVAHCLPRPSERSLPTMRARHISPTLVQRDFARSIRQLGTPAQPPKRRGYSPGSPKGIKLRPRPRLKVIMKSHNKAASP